MFTVKEIKEKIRNLDDNDIVVISSDAEGNEILPFSEIVEESYYDVLNREIVDEETLNEYALDEEMENDEYLEEMINQKQFKKCVIFYPE